jgi:hypothetical protein
MRYLQVRSEMLDAKYLLDLLSTPDINRYRGRSLNYAA